MPYKQEVNYPLILLLKTSSGDMRRFIGVPDLCHVLAQIGTNRDKLNLEECVTNRLLYKDLRVGETGFEPVTSGM